MCSSNAKKGHWSLEAATDAIEWEARGCCPQYLSWNEAHVLESKSFSIALSESDRFDFRKLRIARDLQCLTSLCLVACL